MEERVAPPLVVTLSNLSRDKDTGASAYLYSQATWYIYNEPYGLAEITLIRWRTLNAGSSRRALTSTSPSLYV